MLSKCKNNIRVGRDRENKISVFSGRAVKQSKVSFRILRHYTLKVSATSVHTEAKCTQRRLANEGLRQ